VRLAVVPCCLLALPSGGRPLVLEAPRADLLSSWPRRPIGRASAAARAVTVSLVRGCPVYALAGVPVPLLWVRWGSEAIAGQASPGLSCGALLARRLSRVFGRLGAGASAVAVVVLAAEVCR